MTSNGNVNAWAPNGRRLLISRDRQRRGFVVQDLYTVKLDGTGVRRLTSKGAVQADWSARGRIAFERFNPRLDRSDVFTMSSDGSDLRRLTGKGAEAPSWAPDGCRLAVEMKVGGHRNIVILDARGRTVRILSTRGGEQPEWSPSGKRVAFVRGGSLYVVKADGSGKPRRILRRANSEFLGLSWQSLRRAPRHR